MQLPQRMPYSGAPLVRVLARMTQTGVPASDVSLLDRLSQWLGWTDAIALSSALDGAAPAPASGGDATIATLETALCARTRATLTDAIKSIDSGDRGRRGANARRGDTTHLRSHLGTHPRTHLPAQSQAHLRTHLPNQANVAAHGQADAEPVDFALFRQVYQTQQQSMEHEVGELRVRLRATLATRSERHARLALVDATMERALDARERSVLAAVPALLEAYFRRLRDAAHAEAASATATATEAATASATATATATATASVDSTEARTPAAEAATASEAAPAGSAPQVPQAQHAAATLPDDRATAAAAPRATQSVASARAGIWLDTFRADMRTVLLAELEVRFQPVEGLLAALRAS